MISVGFSAILVPDMCRICVGYVPDSIDFDQCMVLDDERNIVNINSILVYFVDR